MPRRSLLLIISSFVPVLIVYIWIHEVCTTCKCAVHNDVKPSHGGKRLLTSDNDGIKCGAYKELRHVNFQHDSIRHGICNGVEAYSLLEGSANFPLCRLNHRLPRILEEAVQQGSFQSFILSPLTQAKVPCFVYAELDYISKHIKLFHTFEDDNLLVVQTIVKKLSARSPVTFVDIGANIGVFTLPMLDLGVPVVALDANIRNLMRIKLSAEAHNVPPNKLHLLWNFINRRASLMYLNFPADCNMGGATKFGRAVTDTIPVMSTTADSIVGAIGTRSVVLKVDIEGGEGEFFKSARRLFDTFSVPVVLMEWRNGHMSEEESSFMLRFFISRDYSPRLVVDVKQEINITELLREGQDVLWVHSSFLSSLSAYNKIIDAR